MNKVYRLVYENINVILLGVFDPISTTSTTLVGQFETDDLAEMKAKIAELGLELDPMQHADFM